MASSPCSDLPPIARAASSPGVLAAALAYAALGLSVLPLTGKRPALKSWKAWQECPATRDQVLAWGEEGLFASVGIACGPASGDLVILDFDGSDGYAAFLGRFMPLGDTFTVATGSGVGTHVYLRVRSLPEPLKALETPLGNVELLAKGNLAVAPPSRHPRTGRAYTLLRPLDILEVEDLTEVCSWVRSLGGGRSPTTRALRFRGSLKEGLGQHFSAAGYRRNGDWLNGPCPFPENHRHGDENPSFGYNTRSGYGYCHRCGSMTAKSLAMRLGLTQEGEER